MDLGMTDVAFQSTLSMRRATQFSVHVAVGVFDYNPRSP